MNIVVRHAQKTQPEIAKKRLRDNIRKLIGPVYAIKTPNGCPRKYKNSTYTRLLNQRKNIFLTRFKPTNKAFEAGSNLKLCASLDTEETLAYIDCDTHKKGKTADVKILYDRLRTYLPSMLPPVINERGGGNWLKIKTHERNGNTTRCLVTPEEYNGLVVEFERKLNNLGADLEIEHIEFKGKVYEHYSQNGIVTHVKAGDLWKCPPSIEFATQAPLTIAQFKALIKSLPDSPATAAPTKEIEPKTKKEPRYGSFRSRIMTEDQIGRIDDLVKVVDTTFKDRPTTTSQRDAIPVRRFAEVMIAICMMTENADNSNPYRRHEKFINEMVEQGHFRHKFRYAVYKQVRDYMTTHDLIQWHDETYCFDTHKACQWGVNTAVKSAVVDLLAGSTTTTHTVTLITTRIKRVQLIAPKCVTKLSILPFQRPLLVMHADLEPVLYSYPIAA